MALFFVALWARPFIANVEPTKLGLWPRPVELLIER